MAKLLAPVSVVKVEISVTEQTRLFISTQLNFLQKERVVRGDLAKPDQAYKDMLLPAHRIKETSTGRTEKTFFLKWNLIKVNCNALAPMTS